MIKAVKKLSRCLSISPFYFLLSKCALQLQVFAVQVINNDQYQSSTSHCCLCMSLEAQDGWAFLWVKWHLCNMLWICLFHLIFFLAQFCGVGASQLQSDSIQNKSIHRIMTHLEIIQISNHLPSTQPLMLCLIS